MFHPRVPLLLVAALMLGAFSGAPSFGAIVSLTAPAAPFPAGSQATAELVLLNPAAAPASYAVPTMLDGRLSDGTRVWNVNVRAARADVALPAGGFERVPLAFLLPPEATGRLVLELDQPAPVRAVIDVAATAVTRVRGSDLAASEIVQNSPVTLPAANRLKRYYADHFSAHEPMYFIFGDEKPASKFQISLKYRLLSDNGPLATRFPALKGLNVGYTQRSLWDITSTSSPFFDSSYMPEVLFESLAPDTGNNSGFTWIGWQAAFQHESNGRDGASSRSMNIFYVRPMMAFGDLDGWRLILRPKFFVYADDLEDNPDIETYRGYSELRAIFGRNNRLSVSVTGRLGKDFDKGSLQFDVSYPTEFMTGNFAMYLTLQYWNGYGESLLNYNRKSEALRAGFSLAR
jgi:phospholipase A1